MNHQEWAAAEVAKLNPTAAPEGVSEEELLAKVRAGLTREQAIEVILRQQEHDKAPAQSNAGGGDTAATEKPADAETSAPAQTKKGKDK